MKFRLLTGAFLFISLLGSCNKPNEEEDDSFAFIWFEVSGKVVDMAGNPIQGIYVMAESAEDVQTDSNGKFTVNGGCSPSERAVVQFADRDNAGKKYMSKSVVVELEKYKNSSGKWNKGYYRNRNEVVVSLAEESVITPPTTDVETGQGEEQ